MTLLNALVLPAMQACAFGGATEEALMFLCVLPVHKQVQGNFISSYH